MTLTKEAQDYVREIERSVRKIERISPPRLQHIIEGPSSFITTDPAFAIRERLRREKRRDRIVDVVIFIGVFLAALSASTVVALYLCSTW